MTNPVEGVEAPLCVTCGKAESDMEHVKWLPYDDPPRGHPFQPPVSSTPDEGVAVEFKAVRDLLTETLARLEALAIPTSPPVAPREEGASRTPVETARRDDCARCGAPWVEVSVYLLPFGAQHWCIPQDDDDVPHVFVEPVPSSPEAVEAPLTPFVGGLGDWERHPAAPTSEPPREEAGGWTRVGEIRHGDVHWRNEARDIDAIVPLAVEEAIRAPLEAEVARLREAAASSDGLFDEALTEVQETARHWVEVVATRRRALTPDEGGK